jgi:hypothetical protein
MPHARFPEALMQARRSAFLVALLAGLGVIGVASGTWAQAPPDVPSTPVAGQTTPVVPGTDAQAFPVPAPPFSEGVFPCSECHASQPTNLTRRELEVHEYIKLNHGPRDRWCFDCHNPDNRDFLRLASGRLVPFTESYLLCGQCHGDKLRDWKVGVHGKRTGMWNGAKQYLLCAHCHNPHAPHFQPMKPMAPPVRPEDLRKPTESGGAR